jgi:sugar/nucleoside kinase (ribokinase family)
MDSVITLGDLVADLVFTIDRLPVEHEQHQHASIVGIEPGGAGNLLIAGARLGLKVQALGVLGADAFGDAIYTILQAEGVRVENVVRHPDSTTTPVLVLIDPARQHVYIGGKQSGPQLALTPDWQHGLAQADALYLSGFTLLEPQMAAVTQPALAYAHARHTPIFFDPGPFGAEIPWEQRLAVLNVSQVLLITEAEIPLLVHNSPYADQPAALWQQLWQTSGIQICIKRGGQGCQILTCDGITAHPGYPVTVRDTTGAGDAFAAGYIYAYLHGWSLEQIAAFANAVGAAKVQKIGSGRQVPTRQEVQAVLREFGVNMTLL